MNIWLAVVMEVQDGSKSSVAINQFTCYKNREALSNPNYRSVEVIKSFEIDCRVTGSFEGIIICVKAANSL